MGVQVFLPGRLGGTPSTSRASHVVTGDRRFLALGERAGVEIVTPRAFLDLLDSKR